MAYSAESLTLAAKGDTFYLIWAAVLVFFMQCGFAMVEAGTVRAKNTKNILIKNMLDACIGAIIWFLVGFGVAYGGDNVFIGTSTDTYALHISDWRSTYASEGYDWASWFFQFTFAATAATIVSGGVAERCALFAYLVYSVVLTGFVYPVVVHMIWDSAGLISAFNSGSPLLGGVIDFAGSGVVHMTGGIAALAGAAMLGPRIGRFDAEGKPTSMPGHSSVLQILGVFILWLGWYGFNGGSTLSVFALDTAYSRDLARVCVTTTLGAASAALTSIALVHFTSHVWDVSAVGNGVLAGLVSITAGCVVVDPWAAIVIGGLGGLIMQGFSKLLLKLKVDDPLDAFAVHGGCGAWGLIAVGIFCRPEYSYNGLGSHGFIYPGGKPDLLGVQIAALAIIVAWVGTTSTLTFAGLRLLGLLRVPADVEEVGMDVSKHGGDAYDLVTTKPLTA
ncbi:hypothetical protein KFE25_002309 [Diacronema lutheri]|uniref:Ammonium transporter n=1 Tax=Diacronema lutheri TaxID=2081491 RepID=A0A8J5XAI9_DIALT|nr:hypothetical protein KFE25_002309 [Diacronema lutheri]